MRYPPFRRARKQPFLGLAINHHLKWWLLTRKVNVPAFPSSFDVRPELRKNRDIGSAIRNFSNPEKVKGERAELSLQFEHREEQGGDLGTVEEMAKREGVKPLKPKQSKSMNNEES